MRLENERPMRMGPEGKKPGNVRREPAGIGHNSPDQGYLIGQCAIASGSGPKHAILALGYAGWAPGQLENEIQGNGWLHCDADQDLIFGDDVEEKYIRALRKIGIDPGMLSNDAGHA